VSTAQLARVAAGFLAPLGITLAVELMVATLSGLRSRRELAVVAWMNVLTNPLLVYLFSLSAVLGALWQTPASRILVASVLEIAVVVVEWRVMRWALELRSGRALWLSIAMNAASIAAGLALAGIL
jgi:RsiW-degrading membrane proteinase PrsW (M82 family)